MKEKTIYLSTKELSFLKDFAERNGGYVRIDWANGAVWHDLWVAPCPNGERQKVPLLDDDF